MSDFIKKYWDSQAEKYKDSYRVSWNDLFAINLEIENIGKLIQKGDTVLDVGCGNGYSTEKQLIRNPKLIHGVDYSENMIEQAKERETKTLKFSHANVLELPFADNSFDVVYTTRCLINLPTWEQQKEAIKECLRVSKRDVIFSEAFYEPLVTLNAIRQLLSLSPLVEHDFNRYLKKTLINNFLNELKLNFICIDFSSIYYFGSRVLREIISPNNFHDYNNLLNEMFFGIEKYYDAKDIGIQQLYVINV